MSQKFWINTISFDHVQRGVSGGFTQANHGSPHNLKRLQRGDGLIFYSPKTAFEGGEPLQAFTAIGFVTDDKPYQATMSPGFRPYRRTMSFKASSFAPIRPMLDDLSFIEDKQHWGYMFRRGLFEITELDFRLIAAAMHADNTL